MIAVGLTELDRFAFLSRGSAWREVNFWTRTRWGVRALREGDRFDFLLSAPGSRSS